MVPVCLRSSKASQTSDFPLQKSPDNPGTPGGCEWSIVSMVMCYPEKSHIEKVVLGCCSYPLCYPSKFTYPVPSLISRPEPKKALQKRGNLISAVNVCFGLINLYTLL